MNFTTTNNMKKNLPIPNFKGVFLLCNFFFVIPIVGFSQNVIKMKRIVYLLFSLYFLFAGAQSFAQSSIQTGVKCQYLPQPNPSSLAVLNSITIDGTLFDLFVVPSGYEITQVGSNDYANSILRNGTTVIINSSSLGWNVEVLAAFQDYDTVNGWSNTDNPTGSNAPLQDFDEDGIRDWGDTDPISDDLSHIKTIECELFIPNGFSPNDDGIHDYFKISCIENYPNAKIEVYNRWGNLVYEKEEYGNVDRWNTSDMWWDGRSTHKWTVGSEKLPSGTYFYIFYLNDGSETKTGSVFLNR